MQPMSIKLPDTIEFVPGPFDGHVEFLSVNAAEMPENLTCFVSEKKYRLTNGKAHVYQFKITSVAIYERRFRNNAWFYDFVGVTAPSHKQQATEKDLARSQNT